MLSQEKFSTHDRFESIMQEVITTQCVVEDVSERDDNEEDKDGSNGQDIEEVFQRTLKQYVCKICSLYVHGCLIACFAPKIVDKFSTATKLCWSFWSFFYCHKWKSRC